MKKLNKKLFSAFFAASILMNVFIFSASAAGTGLDDGVIRFPSDTKYMLGDTNDDSAVDIRDLVHMKKYLADKDAAKINVSNSDLDGSGKIDADDLSALRKMLLSI